MEDNSPAPGVNSTPPVDNGAGAQPPAQDPVQPSNGSEPVTNPGASSTDTTVPFSRFQEVNDAKRKAEEEAQAAKEELEQFRAAQSQQPSNDEEEIDPEVESLISKVLAKQGYVRKDDLQASQAKVQFDLDSRDLTEQYKNSGVPFESQAVMDWAKQNGFNITNKASLEGAYKVMNQDKIVEQATNKALTNFQENGNKTAGEKPGPGGAKAPEEPEVHGLKGRIAAARQKVSS